MDMSMLNAKFASQAIEIFFTPAQDNTKTLQDFLRKSYTLLSQIITVPCQKVYKSKGLQVKRSPSQKVPSQKVPSQKVYKIR